MRDPGLPLPGKSTALAPGTRVTDPEGHTGTVTGLTHYVTGHKVPQVRWDDGSSTRTGPVEVIQGTGNASRDREMRRLIVRLNCMAGDISAVNPNPSGGKSSEHPGGKQPAGGGMSGQDWWDLYVQSPDRTIAKAEDVLEQAHGPKERPVGETPEQQLARQTDRVLHLHADGGWTTHDMARDSGLTIGQVNKIILKGKIVKRLDAADAKDEERVLHLWREDPTRTVRLLAMLTGLSKSKVHRILHKFSQEKAA